MMKKQLKLTAFLVAAVLITSLGGCSCTVRVEPGSTPAQSSPGQSEPAPGTPADAPAGDQSGAGRFPESQSANGGNLFETLTPQEQSALLVALEALAEEYRHGAVLLPSNFEFPRPITADCFTVTQSDDDPEGEYLVTMPMGDDAMLALYSLAGGVWQLKDCHAGSDQQAAVSAAGLPLEELTVLVFDKAGPGDGGYRYTMTGTQQAQLRALLQPDRWEAATDLPEMGFGSNMRFLSDDLSCALVAGEWDGRTLILMSLGEERTFFLAPPEVAGALDDFAAPFLQTLRAEEAARAAAPAQNTAPHSFPVAVLDAGGQTTGESRTLTLSLPDRWEVRDNEIYEGDRRVAAVLGAYPASASQELWARDPGGSPAQDFAAGELSGRYSLLQEEVSEGGVTAIKNTFFYDLDTGSYIVELEFVPASGVGIGTQREQFEGYLSSAKVE